MAILWPCRGCDAAIFSSCKEKNECCPSGPQDRAQCLLVSPGSPQPSLSSAGSSARMFWVWGQSWPRAQRKPAAPWGCQGQFCTCLLLQERSVRERKAGFSTHALEVPVGLCVSVARLATAFLQDVCLPQKQHNFLAIYFSIHGSSFLLVLDFLLVLSNCEEKTPGGQTIQ